MPVPGQGYTQDRPGRTYEKGRGASQPVPSVETTGWRPTCEHDPYSGDTPSYYHAPATVLDPFGGAGTTAVVARKLGRKAILLELNSEYCALAARRLQQQSLFA